MECCCIILAEEDEPGEGETDTCGCIGGFRGERRFNNAGEDAGFIGGNGLADRIAFAGDGRDRPNWSGEAFAPPGVPAVVVMAAELLIVLDKPTGDAEAGLDET